MKTCSVSGCTRPICNKSRKYCGKHAYNWYKYGTIIRPIRVTRKMLLDELLKIKTNDCVEFHYSLNNEGYGALCFHGKKIYAHRYAWQKIKDNIPEGLCVLHKCDNPKCVNIGHLFLGTMRDNTRDMIAKGREYRVYGEETTGAKLKTKQVLYIRNSDQSSKTLAKKFNVTYDTITKIRRGATWRHLLPKANIQGETK